ncbi:MAG: hypothetical protein JWN70_6154 [Planctomycetaceae bacterium]|nr:hypothetical protein [Planctomycetaceae bacterium]
MSYPPANWTIPHDGSDGEPLPEQMSSASVHRHSMKRQQRAGEFLKGPIPLKWLCRASTLQSRSAITVGLMLWFRAGCLKRDEDLTLGTELRDAFGVSRQAFYRGLDDLQSAGLVTTERMPGRTAKISIRDTEKCR